MTLIVKLLLKKGKDDFSAILAFPPTLSTALLILFS